MACLPSEYASLLGLGAREGTADAAASFGLGAREEAADTAGGEFAERNAHRGTVEEILHVPAGTHEDSTVQHGSVEPTAREAAAAALLWQTVLRSGREQGTPATVQEM